MSVTVKTDFSKAPRFRANVLSAVTLGVNRAAVILQGEMKQMIQRKGAVSMPYTPPVYQRGTLQKSMKSGPMGPLAAWAGSTVKYGGFLERGVTITPKNVKYLPVPLNPAASRLLQVSAGGLKNGPTKMRVVKTKTGKLFLVAEEKNKKPGERKIAKGDWLFVLKKSVTIKPRPWASPAVVKAGPRMVAEFARTARAALRAGMIGGKA